MCVLKKVPTNLFNTLKRFVVNEKINNLYYNKDKIDLALIEKN